MNRSDAEKFLLYLEPELHEKSAQPIDDAWSQFMAYAVNNAPAGVADFAVPGDPSSGVMFQEGASWRSTHRTPCGNYSSVHDYKLADGSVTNSLAPFYLRWYRSAISEAEMQKLRDVHDFYVRMGLAKPIIEGAEPQVFTDTVKTAPDPETGKITPRPLSFEEEPTVDLTDPKMLPVEERPEPPSDFEITR